MATDDIKLMAFICESPFTQRKEEREKRWKCVTMEDIGWRKNYCFLEQEKLFSTFTIGTSEGG